MSATSIQDQAIARYDKNLAYFQEHHPEVYKKIFLLDTAISQGQYKEKYELEYKEEGYFDVKELITGAYLYGQNSNELAKQAAKSVNFLKTDNVIETFYNFNFTESAAKKADEELDVCDSSFATIAPVIQYITSNIPKETEMKKIYKYIFFGVGLGLHLPKIDEKINALTYFIVETDLELFRLSLFITDYTSFHKQKKLIFSIAEDRASFLESFQLFYEHLFVYNHYLKYFILTDSYFTFVKEIQSKLVTMSHMSYTHDNLLKKNIRVLKNLKNNYHFLKLPSLNTGIFQDKPLIFIAAGPSLNKNIHWLQKNYEKFVIVSVFMAIPTLKKHNIVPDIVIHVDEAVSHLVKVAEQNDIRNYLDKTVFIFAASLVMDTALEYIDQNRIFLVEDRTKYKKGHGGFEGMSVGEMGYSFCLRTGAESIYLLGLDLALDQETGSTHAKEHTTQHKVDLDKAIKNDSVETSVSMRNSLLTRKGNFREKVFTTPLFDGSIHILNMHTEKYKQPFQKVYNLNDGAFFKDTIPLHTQDVKLKMNVLDKDLIRYQINDFFLKISTNKLTEKEKKLFTVRLEDANLKLEAIEVFSSKRIVTLQTFYDTYIQTIQKLLNKPSNDAYELTEIYALYLKYISGYVTELTNTKKLSNPKKHIKKFQRILSRQLKKFVEKYIEAIKNVE